MRSALVLVLLPMPMPIDEEDCLVAVVAAGGSGFPGALTTYIIRDGNYAQERCSTCGYICTLGEIHRSRGKGRGVKKGHATETFCLLCTWDFSAPRTSRYLRLRGWDDVG